jgi:hypothetical protein
LGKPKEDRVKTTISFTKQDYGIIKSSGLEITSFCDKMLDLAKKYSLMKWDPGEGVLRIDSKRIILVSQSTLKLFFEGLPPEVLKRIGRTIGKNGAAEASVLKLQLKRQDVEDELLSRAFNLTGYGHAEILEDKVIIKQPILNIPEFYAGLLEGLCEKKAEIQESPEGVLIFKMSH